MTRDYNSEVLKRGFHSIILNYNILSQGNLNI